MKTITKLLGVAMVGLLAFTGFAAATGGVAVGAAETQMDAADIDRPLDGSNSPWVADDARLGRFQERFDLTDSQVDAIQEEVAPMIEDGASQDEIRSTVTAMLEQFGVDDPALGPTGDRMGNGQFGQGPGNGAGGGPYGPADGSCLG